MPYDRPTFGELVDDSRNDLASRIPGADARLRANALNADAAVWGAGMDGVYGRIQFLLNMAFLQSAVGPFLDRLAALVKVFRKQPQAAIGAATIVGTNGDVFPKKTLLQRGDGAQFITTTDAAVSGTTAALTVVATLAGVAGNTDGGTALNVVTPVGRFATTVTVGADGLENGTALERDDDLRARAIERWQMQPQGGATWDYPERVKELAGITRAWVFPHWQGAGTVSVAFVMDDQAGGILPDDATVAAAQAYLRDPSWDGPIGETSCFKLVLDTVLFSIQIDQRDADVEKAIKASLDALFLREQSPGGAFLPPDGTKTAGVIQLGDMWDAIVSARGEREVELLSPSADFVAANGHLPVRGLASFSTPP